MSKTDNELIEDLQNGGDNTEPLDELILRHSGIYVDIVNRYVRENFGLVRKEDILQERQFNIYRCALKFDKNKNTKFSTFLGNETKWMCLNLYNRNKKEINNTPLVDADLDHRKLDLLKVPVNDRIDLEMKKEISTIINTAPDSRIKKIFNMRYWVGERNSVMPWKKIGKEVNLSIQGCINIHDKGIRYIQDKLGEELND